MYTAVVLIRFGFAHKWEHMVKGSLFTDYEETLLGYDETNKDPNSLEDYDSSDKLRGLIERVGIGWDDEVKAHNTLVLVNRVADAMKQFKVELSIFFADKREAKRVTYVKDYSRLITSQWTLDRGEDVEEAKFLYKSEEKRSDGYRESLAMEILGIIHDDIFEDMSDELDKLIDSISA